MDQDVTRQALPQFIEEATKGISDACTRCGRCVQVCPVVPFANLLNEDPKQVISGVIDAMAANTAMPPASERWAKQCNGCGACIPICPAGINPRQMLLLAWSKGSAAGHGRMPNVFRKMARAIRIMASMQLVPKDVERLLKPPKPRDVDVVFYTGCNANRTPHVLFNAMTILDALELNYEVLGGTSTCCGVIHSKWQGDLAAGGRISKNTLKKFGDFQPKKVLNWCPTCQLHLGETLSGYRATTFDLEHFAEFLIRRGQQLVSRFETSVNMRVLVHVHKGIPELGLAVVQLLGAIPGLTVVDAIEEPGYTCGVSGSARSPGLRAVYRDITNKRSTEPGIDALISLTHSCHMQLAQEGRAHGFKVLNFTDLLVRALGEVPYEDAGERFRKIADWREIAREALPLLRANGIRMDAEQLASLLPEILSLAEFRGGLCQLAPKD